MNEENRELDLSNTSLTGKEPQNIQNKPESATLRIVPLREKTAYGAYFVGQNFFYALINAFLVTYMLFLGVHPAKTGAVMLAVKIWDAVNDGIFGWLIDKAKFTGKAKFMPWIRISAAFIPMATILLFSIPTGSTEVVKLAWLAIAYLLWDSAYTVCDVPIYGMVTTMTPNLRERTTLMSIGSICAGAGGGITSMVCTILVSEKVGLGFSWAAVVLSIAGFCAMLPLCIMGKERNIVPKTATDKSFTIKEMFRYIASNKFLLIYFLGILFYAGLQTNLGLSLFVSYYMFNNTLFSIFIGISGAIPMTAFAFILPHIIKKIDKFKLFYLCNFAFIAMSVLIWAVGYQSVWLHIALCAVRGIPAGAQGVILFMFTPDCAEYGKYKTGTDAKGITFALQTFTAKLTAAIAISFGLFLLSFFGWVSVEVKSFAELASSGITQTPTALWGLWFVYNLVPALGAIGGAVAWSFYKLKDKDVQLMAECNAGLRTKEETEKYLSRKY